MSFMCGFSGNQEDDVEDLCILQSSPQRKTTRRRPSFGSRGNKDSSKNPYSNRGLDKFEALLADLDLKRQMIYTQKGSEDISLVRFTYSSSNDVRPIVVKVKDHKKQGKKSGGDAVVQPIKPSVDRKKSVGLNQLRRKFGEWWRPWYGFPLFVILIMVFLVFFDRCFAIFCTSVGWYMVPTTNGKSEIAKPPERKNIQEK